MTVNHFSVQLAWRIILIAVCCFVAAYLWIVIGNLYFLIPMVFAGLLIYGLIHYLNRTNRKMAFLIESIRNEDFSVHFEEDSGPESLRDLHVQLNNLNQLIRRNFIRHEEQERYHRLILDQLHTGVLIYNRQGHILISNPAAGKLLNCVQLHHIRQIERSVPGLYEVLSDSPREKRKLIEFATERETVQLVMEFSRIMLRDDALTLVTIQNIHQELDQKETDSWIRLIRVLTHEIMNTITPITSISDTLVRYYKKSDNGDVILDAVDADQIRNTVRGLEVINVQGSDLMSFVQSYRDFLHIPEPEKTIIPVPELFEKIEILVGEEYMTRTATSSNFNLEWMMAKGDETLLDIFADEKQITRILVNLCKNAIHSLEGQVDPTLRLNFDRDEDGRSFIEVTDNGSGIDSEIRDQIFIPFFTTRANGTGIGLSLSRKIMQMHGGSLVLIRSQPFVETTFRMVF